jgi:hypothetical protein
MRASRRYVASRSCSRSSAMRFLGRGSIMMQGSLRCAGAVRRSERTVASSHPLAELRPQFAPNVHRHLASTALGAMARVVKAEREDSGTRILAVHRQGARGSIVPIRRRETSAIVVSRAHVYDVFAAAHCGAELQCQRFRALKLPGHHEHLARAGERAADERDVPKTAPVLEVLLEQARAPVTEGFTRP